jgi:thiosulfate/3-mercaptopyruvate sulfurtransferase
MIFRTLIDVETVADHLADLSWVIVDCRFDLADAEAGWEAYEAAHIPGAVYAHLDEDLSGPPLTDKGRHPLPSPAALTRLFGRLGIDQGKQVVVYDNANGVFAARLWWMLRYMGHEAVAVLDGGWPAWAAAGLPTQAGEEENETAVFTGAPRRDWLVTIEAVDSLPLLVDARSPERYAGAEEPLDPRPGHIPGAVNFFFSETWGKNGRYLPPNELRAKLEDLLGDMPADKATFYCGSGVSACVNLLALAHVGLGDGRLYVGSWSEWSADPERPAVVNNE